MSSPSEKIFQYEPVTGIFAQDDPNTDALTFDYTRNFGLLPSFGTANTYQAPWSSLTAHLKHLNSSSPRGVRYVCIFLGRHGQGYHNVAETKFGTEAWDAHYSRLHSYEGMVFFDAHLTDIGKQQASVAHDTWQKALAAGLEAPESYYVSPLDRCLETATITFTGLDLPQGRPFKPLVKEMIREVIGEHTCDQRGPRSGIAQRYPDFVIEEGFAEDDPLWKADERETDDQIDERMHNVLNEIFGQDDATFLSITIHSGAIASILRVVGHRPFALQTGGVIPVVLKITRQN